MEILSKKGIIANKGQNIMERILSDRALSRASYEDRNKIRADLQKKMMLATIEE